MLKLQCNIIRLGSINLHPKVYSVILRRNWFWGVNLRVCILCHPEVYTYTVYTPRSNVSMVTVGVYRLCFINLHPTSNSVYYIHDHCNHVPCGIPYSIIHACMHMHMAGNGSKRPVLNVDLTHQYMLYSRLYIESASETIILYACCIYFIIIILNFGIVSFTNFCAASFISYGYIL